MSWGRGNSGLLERAGPTLVPYDHASTPAERKRLMALQGGGRDHSDDPLLPASWATIGAGAPGGLGGRVPWEAKAPVHYESTAAIRGLYPWIPGAALPRKGPMLGRDAWSGCAWCFDPWELRRLGIVGDSGIFTSGVIGSGKSLCAKAFCLRHVGFGRPFVVSGDIRGEWVPVAEAVGGKIMRLGPGQPDRLNALAMPPKPDGIDSAEWWLTVRTHWESLLVALIETMFRDGRKLNPTETTAIELSLDEATNYHGVSGDLTRVAPIWMAKIVELLRDPTQYMAETVGMDRGRLQDEIRDIALSLRRLTAGSLQGLVDSDSPTNQIDPRSPATCVDLSRVQTSDASLALVMACTQATIELSMAHRVQQWISVHDEYWRMLRFPELVRRDDASQRISRRTGACNLFISHRMSEGESSDRTALAALRDLQANCATKVIFKQRADTVSETVRMVDLSDMAEAEIMRLGRGRALWVVEGKPYVVDHIVAPPTAAGFSELDVFNTDQALEDSYRTLAGKSAEQLWGDAA